MSAHFTLGSIMDNSSYGGMTSGLADELTLSALDIIGRRVGTVWFVDRPIILFFSFENDF